jgi:hypothetical protein
MKAFLIPVMCLVLLGCQSSIPTAGSREPQTHAGEDEGGRENLNTNPILIGVVENGVLRIVLPKSFLSGSIRFTSIAMQMAVPPESGELDLSQYEGRAIAIQGHNGGGWIYSARVIDSGGPIVTALVRQAFDQ